MSLEIAIPFVRVSEWKIILDDGWTRMKVITCFKAKGQNLRCRVTFNKLAFSKNANINALTIMSLHDEIRQICKDAPAVYLGAKTFSGLVTDKLAAVIKRAKGGVFPVGVGPFGARFVSAKNVFGNGTGILDWA